jgi:LysM repeat protein
MVFAQTGKWVLITAMVLVVLLVWTSPVSLASQMHTVRQGDTLYKISQAYGVSVNSIRQASGLTTDVIYPVRAAHKAAPRTLFRRETRCI